MCSISDPQSGTTASRFAALVESAHEINARIAGMLADPETASEIAGIPGDALAGFVHALSAAASAATASMTAVIGQLHATSGRGTGVLIAGRYASTNRFLEVEAGMSKKSASATIARARALRGDYTAVGEAWLTGRIGTDAVGEITLGMRDVLTVSRLPAAEREVARTLALEVVLPVAEQGTVADVRRVIGHLRLLTDPVREAQAEVEADAEQRLTCEQVGPMSKITAWLTNQNAAAVMTVLECKVATRIREGDVAPEDQLAEGVDPELWEGRRQSRNLHAHLLALVLADTLIGLLDDKQVGTHHAVAPHVTVTVDLERWEAGLGGDLTMPGSDISVLLTSATVRRILCDADVTTVVVRPWALPDPAALTHSGEGSTSLADLLLERSREVLYVGRAERTVPPRLRRALEARDRRCAFPHCHAHVRRCQAHHVHEWEHGGTTGLNNCVMLCVRHHHAVHEGGWKITRAAGIPPGGTGFWEFTPPARPRRP